MKKHVQLEHRNNEHKLVVGETYSFTDNDGNVERGRLLYLYTRRVYKTDKDGNLDHAEWKVIHFRTGYIPEVSRPGVGSVHLELGLFKVG